MSVRRILNTSRSGLLAALSALALGLGASAAFAAPDLVVGNTAPYSGPASAYSIIGKSLSAYFDMLNDKGGINGRKIKFISYDDSYSPPKAVEQVRRLVESDNVSVVLGLLGTANNAAVQKYLNAKQIPQLFSVTASGRFNNPGKYPWTMGLPPTIVLEAKTFAKYLLENKPNAKIGILYQNDDLGRDAAESLKAGLGARAAEMIVSTQKYEVSDPTVDSQVVALQASGADVFYNAATVRTAAQAIRKADSIGWKPLQLLSGHSANIQSVLKPAGIEASKGIVATLYWKEPSDPQWASDPAITAYRQWMAKYNASEDPENLNNLFAYGMGMAFQAVIEACGDDVSKENIMAKAASLNNLELGPLMPGITLKTSKTDYFPVQQLRLARFDGQRWVMIGDVVTDESEDVSGRE